MNNREVKTSQKIIIKKYKCEISREYALYKLAKLYAEHKGENRV